MSEFRHKLAYVYRVSEAPGKMIAKGKGHPLIARCTCGAFFELQEREFAGLDGFNNIENVIENVKRAYCWEAESDVKVPFSRLADN